MLTFKEFEWAAFIYWAVSYRGPIGGDSDYMELMDKATLLERLRNEPEELTSEEISKHIILFLNRWKCRIKDDEPTAQAVKQALVAVREKNSRLKSRTVLDIDRLSGGETAEVVAIYDAIRRVPYFGPTATSKLMHIVNPDLFVMSDGFIFRHYAKSDPNIRDSGSGYAKFLSAMCRLAREVRADFEKQRPGEHLHVFLSDQLGYKLRKSLSQFMDEYNWITITKNMPVPPPWWPR